MVGSGAGGRDGGGAGGGAGRPELPRGQVAWRHWREVCSVCGRVWAPADLRWLCACGGLLDLAGPLADPLTGATGEVPGASPLRRYGAVLPPGADSVDLGMSVTRLEEVQSGRYVKADYEHPTGSFKDRGAAVMIGAALSLGVESVVVDSSGNAGKSVAAHSARAGIDCEVYVPGGTDPAKVAAIANYGAKVLEVGGGRTATAQTAQDEVRRTGRWYASHVHQPMFHHGVKTLAYELYEQLPQLGCPGAAVVVPVGNGTLVLGLWLGFGELVALGRLARRPAIVAVQAEGCAPLAGLAPASAGPATSAAGIAIPAPERAAQVRAAVLVSGGRVLTVAEEAIGAARAELDGWGLDVEPTGAVAWAAVPQMGAAQGAPIVAVLTGR